MTITAVIIYRCYPVTPSRQQPRNALGVQIPKKKDCPSPLSSPKVYCSRSKLSFVLEEDAGEEVEEKTDENRSPSNPSAKASAVADDVSKSKKNSKGKKVAVATCLRLWSNSFGRIVVEFLWLGFVY